MGLRSKPSDRGRLCLAHPGLFVPRAEKAAEVLSLAAQPPAGLAGEVLGSPGVRDVLIEGHPLRKPLRRHDATAAIHGRERSGGRSEGQGLAALP